MIVSTWALTVKCLKAMLSNKCLGMIHFPFVAATQMSAAKDAPSLHTRSLTVLPCRPVIVWCRKSHNSDGGVGVLFKRSQALGGHGKCGKVSHAAWICRCNMTAALWRILFSDVAACSCKSRLHGFTYINSWWKNQLALVARLRKPVIELITEVCHKFSFQGMCRVYLSTHRSIVKMEKCIELENYANLHGYKIIAVIESGQH